MKACTHKSWEDRAAPASYSVTQSWTSFNSKLALISDLAGAKLHSSKNVQNNEVCPNLKFPGKQNLLCRLQMQFLGVGNRKNCQGYKYFPERKDMNKISLFFFSPHSKRPTKHNKDLKTYFTILLVFNQVVFVGKWKQASEGASV